MKRIYFTAIACFFSLLIHAQQPFDNGIKNIRKESIEAHLSFLAGDALEGRAAGRRGGFIAAEYIKAVLQESGVKPFYDSYFQAFEVYDSGNRLNLRNVVAFIEGERKDEYVIVGAHYDHIGMDESLVGDQIYNGADDNASSVAAVLQVAKAFAVSGEKPLRTIVFAFWDGEEIDYLGSQYFVSQFADISGIKAYVNLDMIGREGVLPVLYPAFSIPEKTKENTAEGKQFHLLYTEELSSLRKQLDKEIKENHWAIEAKPNILVHPSRGSDFYPFSLRSIPILWFFTGLHPDYHAPSDEVSSIDLDKVTDIAKATYWSVWEIAGRQ